MTLLIHPSTAKQVDSYLINPSHALLIEGIQGTGKGMLALNLAAKLLGKTEAQTAYHPYFMRIATSEKAIPIASVREIQQFMRLKTAGTGAIRRIVIVEDADGMTIEGQNAFLKLLEEPPEDTVIILTAVPNSALLPTIYSRVQRIKVTSPTKAELTSYFKDKGEEESDIARAYYISEGSIGLMTLLLQKDTQDGMIKQINLAKQIMGEKPHDRLVRVDPLSKDKDMIPDLLFALQRVTHAVLVQASERSNTQQIKRAYKSLKRIIDAQNMLAHNPNPKLLLTDLFLNI